MAYVDKAYDGVARVLKDIRDTHIRELLADEFSTDSTYKTGDLVIYDGGLYRFKEDHAAGAWNAAQVEETTIDDAITDLKISFALFQENIPGTVQTIAFDSAGNVQSITHMEGTTAVRTDVFTFGTSTITEVRTLSTGESLTIVTNTDTLETTTTYADAA